MQRESLEEVIQAAKADKEPAYIKYLMEAISMRLQVAAQKSEVITPKQLFAWVLTMRMITAATYLGFERYRFDDWSYAFDHRLSWARQRAWNEAALPSHYEARKIAIETLARGYKAHTPKAKRKAVSFLRILGLQLIVPYGTTTAALRGSTRTVKGKRIVFRVAEWAMLNYFLENIELVFQNTFSICLETLPDHPSNCSWEDLEISDEIMR